MDKVLKIILCGVGIGLLLVVGGIAGVLIERDNQETLEAQKESVSRSAFGDCHIWSPNAPAHFDLYVNSFFEN